MNKIQRILSVGVVAFGTTVWGIDEHRPIQGGTTNPTPTGPTDHTPIQNTPDTTSTTTSTTTLTPTPVVPVPPPVVPAPTVRKAKTRKGATKTTIKPNGTTTTRTKGTVPKESTVSPDGTIGGLGTSPTLTPTPK